ncbi:MAG: SUMF1/EgtB/PvdO family nonheme iron enzyme [Anaerolineales bacterium]|nr:SUMF1/EgtB/PvdO family nonheme iron enzyme [Anaerolineales bacterium]
MTTPGKGRIFISYRRADSAGYAGRIYDRLTAHFGEDTVFMDVDTIEAGLDFVEVLQNAVQCCDVLVALIGRSWLNIKDETGKRRLDNPEDFVRIEIAAALSRNIRVIPVLVDGATMPRSTELPDNLKPLVRRNALQVNHQSFNADAHRLIAQLELALKAAEDSKILKAQALKEERARAQRQAEIKRLLEAADLAISLKDWELALEKLNGVLNLDVNHVDAQAKFDIVQLKISEIEAEHSEKTRKEKEAADKAVKEKAEREAAVKAAREEAAEKARRDRILWGKKEAEEKARKVALRKDRLQETAERIKNVFSGGRKLPLFIGGGIVILFLLGYLIKSAFTPSPPAPPTETPLLTFAISTESPTKFPLTPTFTPESEPTATKTPGEHDVGSTMISEKDGMTMVYVPAGEFQMGSENGDSSEKPLHAVDLDSFWMDRTEVTHAMYARCVNDSGCYEPSNEKYYDYDYADHPMVNVSWYDAVNYCKWAERRLPSEEEWEKAAQGGLKVQVYPWGYQEPVCEQGVYNGAQHSNCGERTVSVGSFGENGYGLYDMAGNVWEWVNDWYDAYPGGDESASSDFGRTYRVLRGGSWKDNESFLRTASRGRYNPTSVFNNIGFRCALSP